MPFITQCPYCPAQIKLPDGALAASVSCPKCRNAFTAVPHGPAPVSRTPTVRAVKSSVPAGATAGAPKTGAEPFHLGPSQLPGVNGFPDPAASVSARQVLPQWVNGWGLAAVGLAGLALVCASLGRWYWLTVALSALGLASVLVGILVARDVPKTKDRVWWSCGGLASGAALCLAVFAPQVLNGFWAIDFTVPRPDLDKQLLVSWAEPQGGKPLPEGEWADAATEAIRQHDVFLRVKSVKAGPLPESGPTASSPKYLLVHLQLLNAGHERKIQFESYSRDRPAPALMDDRGRSYAFRDQRFRKPTKGTLVFEAAARQKKVQVAPTAHVEVLLIFEAPPAGLEVLKLELPAAAWGRKGVCRLRISRFFEATSPHLKQK